MAADGPERASGRPPIPLPGLLVALFLVALVHGPLWNAPPLFDEGPFLAGASESRGAVLGMQWLSAEQSLLGGDVRAHRAFALALEMALLGLAAASPLVRASRAPSLALLALAAFLIHPWRTESFVRLGARAVLVSEPLLLGGLLAAWSAGRRSGQTAGLLLLAAGASGMPAAPALALPWLWSASDAAAPRARAAAVALVAGAAAWWPAAPPAAPLAAVPAGLELLARPWRTGLVHLGATPLQALSGAALLLVLLALALRARDAAAACGVTAAAVALVAAPSLRPPRTGLELLGPGLTPEAWLTALALIHFAAWRLAGAGSWRRLPLLLLAALAIGSGFVHARRFTGEAELLRHAVAAAPDAVELRVAEAQLLLRRVGYAPPQLQPGFAATALGASEAALRRRPGDVAATTLQCLALALMGRLDDARAGSDRLLQRAPDDWRARAGRAEIEALAGDDLAALSWLRSAVDVHRAPFLQAQAAALLDRIYEQIRLDLTDRDWEGARRRCERLLALAPEEVEARTTWVDTFTLQGDLPRALEEARRLHAERPDDARIVRRLASLCQQLGLADEARDHERRLLALPALPDRSPH